GPAGRGDADAADGAIAVRCRTARPMDVRGDGADPAPRRHNRVLSACAPRYEHGAGRGTANELTNAHGWPGTAVPAGMTLAREIFGHPPDILHSNMTRGTMLLEADRSHFDENPS